MIYQNIAILIIALSLFFFAISLLSKYLNKYFNKKAQELITKLSKNPLLMFGLGIVFSFLLHSSSALIALIITFVAANLISVKGALNITLGANIGTTLTALITIINFSKVLPIIFLLGITLIYLKKEIGSFIFSFGLLYFSLDMFSTALNDFVDERALIQLLSSLNSLPIFALLIGIMVVAIIQSSTLFLSLLKNLSTAGAIGIKGLIGLILGANIGTTADAFLVCHNKKGLKIALFNLGFNICGALIFLILINPYSKFISSLNISTDSIPIFIHFSFNLFTAIAGYIIINHLLNRNIFD